MDLRRLIRFPPKSKEQVTKAGPSIVPQRCWKVERFFIFELNNLKVIDHLQRWILYGATHPEKPPCWRSCSIVLKSEMRLPTSQRLVHIRWGKRHDTLNYSPNGSIRVSASARVCTDISLDLGKFLHPWQPVYTGLAKDPVRCSRLFVLLQALLRCL